MSLPSLRPLTYFLFCGAFFTAVPVVASVDTSEVNKVPAVPMMQTTIWRRFDLADFTLNGEIRTDKTKKHYPIILHTRGHELVYEFTDQPLQIRMVVGQDGTLVQRRTSSSAPWQQISPQDRLSRILDTDITYEDLSLDFINWDDVTPVGTDAIKTLPAYAYDAVAGPTDVSSYKKVRFWVSSQFWAFLRVDAYNAQNQVIKLVEVQDVMTIKNYTVFKQMRIASIIPGTNDLSSSTTFITIADGHEGSGLPPVTAQATPIATGNPIPPGPPTTDTVNLNAPSTNPTPAPNSTPSGN